MDTVERVIHYINLLEGVKYTHCNQENSFTNWDTVKDIAPFWIGKKPLPRNDMIIRYGICCVGLINLMRRFLNLSIPHCIDTKTGNIIFIGGTSSWFQYLSIKNRLQIIDIDKTYSKGTLLLQDYNKEDQGHVAVIVSNNKTLRHARKIHAISHLGSDKYNCVLTETFDEYPYKNRYTHICLPENWLLKN
tara:strand:- start:394 stop:963 length:570 start_codon:yes stop_codon:yes gene_type:complete